MMFLNIMLAGFVALGAVPIIIHLLNKQRFKVIEWAAIQFLLKTLQKNSKRLQMRDLILLALRTCAIVFAALALARPTIAPGRFSLLGGGGGLNSVVVLDNSLSMGCLDGNDTRFSVAKVKAKAVIDQLPKGSGAALVLMSDVAQAEVSEPSHDLGFVAGAIDKAALSDGGTSLAVALAKAWDILKHVDGAREIYIFTDMQANAWPSTDDASWKSLAAEIASHKDVRLYLADASRAMVDNVSIDRLEPEDELVTSETDTTFIATVRNHASVGSAAAANVEVELLVDDGRAGELRKAASTVLDHLDGTQEVRLETRFAEGGRHRVQARIGADHLPADNARYLSVDVIDRVRVLIVDGSSEGGYAGGAGFIRAALSPGAAVDEEGVAKNLIDTTVIAPGALADTALDTYQAVILSDVAELPSSLADGLKAFVASGKGLIIFLGANVKAESYNAQLGERAGVLPARLSAKPIEFPGENGTKGIGLSTAALTHPIMAFFADKETQPYLAQPRFYQAYTLEVPAPPTPAAGAPASDASVVVASFSDGKPALVERALGNGSVLLFAGSADKEWSDFPLRPAFLMVTRRAVQHVVLSRRNSPTVRVHDPIVAILPAKDAGARLATHDPRGGAGAIAAVLSPDGRSARAEIPDTPFAGFYDLAREDAVLRFAANAPRDESILDTLSPEALRERSAGLEWQLIASESDVGAQVTRGRVGREIWPLLLAIVVGCLLAESILAARWAPKGA